MSTLAKALLAELDDTALDALAERLAPRLAGRLGQSNHDDGWLDITTAAAYLACPKSRLYALCSARRVPHHKDGSRTLFRRSELDEWVRSGGARRP